MSRETTRGDSSPPGPSAASAAGLSTRTFWAVFAVAWIAYWSLTCSFYLTLSGVDGWSALTFSAVSTLPPALPAIAVALRRRDLLNPERPLRSTVSLQLAVGVAYVATATVLATIVESWLPIELPGELDQGPGMAMVGRIVGSLFLFVMLLGYLMWTESLNRVAESRALVAHEAVLRAQAEAKALRAQFNPHFVFNTLHSLMLLVRAEPDTAERAIEDVAELIRYASTLQRRGVDQVTLAKELAFARRYTSLEQLRLEERLGVDWDVHEGIEEMLVPAFSLQTLLENAIKHGISVRPEGGSVTIRAALENGQLALTVADDGAGADASRVPASGGSGLDLLERRLAAVYGGDASLEWRTAPGEGFTATVRVPANRATVRRRPLPGPDSHVGDV